MDLRFVAKKLLEHDEQFREIRKENTEYRNQILTKLDKIVTSIDRLDQERLFQIHRLDRHEKDIDKLKQQVGLTD